MFKKKAKQDLNEDVGNTNYYNEDEDDLYEDEDLLNDSYKPSQEKQKRHRTKSTDEYYVKRSRFNS